MYYIICNAYIYRNFIWILCFESGFWFAVKLLILSGWRIEREGEWAFLVRILSCCCCVVIYNAMRTFFLWNKWMNSKRMHTDASIVVFDTKCYCLLAFVTFLCNFLLTWDFGPSFICKSYVRANDIIRIIGIKPEQISNKIIFNFV